MVHAEFQKGKNIKISLMLMRTLEGTEDWPSCLVHRLKYFKIINIYKPSLFPNHFLAII